MNCISRYSIYPFVRFVLGHILSPLLILLLLRIVRSGLSLVPHVSDVTLLQHMVIRRMQ